VNNIITNLTPMFGRLEKVAGELQRRSWKLDTLCDASVLSDPAARQKALDALAERAGEVEYLSVATLPIREDFFEKAAKLKVVIKHGAGVDNIDTAAATRRKIPVVNAPGANADAVAELAVAFMLALARDLCGRHELVRSGGWQRFLGTEIAGKTLGIVGLGQVGRSLARKAQALGMRIVACDLKPDAEFCRECGIRLMELPKLLAEADYVSLHVFGGKGNARLMGEAELGLMRPGARLLNLARGEVLDMDALARALESGRLAGAALDVFPEEPPLREHPVFRLPNVIFSPHTAADTQEALTRVGLMNLEDFDLVRAGKRPARVLNPEIYA
jgi:D-3-phosphoglycerate dehydrogenase